MIVGQIESSTTDLDRAIADAHREISLLREYRTRLIADVVTGKVDVRDAAARLPDDSDEVEQSGEIETPRLFVIGADDDLA